MQIVAMSLPFVNFFQTTFKLIESKITSVFVSWLWWLGLRIQWQFLSTQDSQEFMILKS